MRRELTRKLLAEFLRNSRRSDRELARTIKTSQPTITRARRKIEDEGLVRSYTIIPDWKKLGFEILVLTFVKMRPEVVSEEVFTKLKEYSQKFPNVVFASRGHGLSMTGVILSIHEDYRDYSRKIAVFRQEWAKYLEDIQNFVMVTEEGVIKDFSFAYLTDLIEAGN
jgi:DNA-binding Lrp family transcriptional regulator